MGIGWIRENIPRHHFGNLTDGYGINIGRWAWSGANVTRNYRCRLVATFDSRQFGACGFEFIPVLIRSISVLCSCSAQRGDFELKAFVFAKHPLELLKKRGSTWRRLNSRSSRRGARDFSFQLNRLEAAPFNRFFNHGRTPPAFGEWAEAPLRKVETLHILAHLCAPAKYTTNEEAAHRTGRPSTCHIVPHSSL